MNFIMLHYHSAFTFPEYPQCGILKDISISSFNYEYFFLIMMKLFNFLGLEVLRPRWLPVGMFFYGSRHISLEGVMRRQRGRRLPLKWRGFLGSTNLVLFLLLCDLKETQLFGHRGLHPSPPRLWNPINDCKSRLPFAPILSFAWW